LRVRTRGLLRPTCSFKGRPLELIVPTATLVEERGSGYAKGRRGQFFKSLAISALSTLSNTVHRALPVWGG